MNYKVFSSMAIFIILCLQASGQEQNGPYLGSWGIDMHDMPYFSYIGELPYSALLKNGEKASISDDPYFLLGNYRFKLFAHVSGEYEIYSTERVISHFNSKENSSASLRINSQDYILTGTNSLAADPESCSRVFGAGFAEYTYTLPSLICKRVLSVLPSEEIHKGISAFRISVTFKNTSKKKVKIEYSESLKALYDKITNSAEHDDLEYKLDFINAGSDMVRGITKIVGESDPFPIIDNRDDVSYNEYYPPVLYISAEFEGKEKLTIFENRCTGNLKSTLKPGEETSIDFIIGYSLRDSSAEIEKARKSLMSIEYHPDMSIEMNPNPVSLAWNKRVDHFYKESDTELRRELIWHNYVLESLATYSDYFEETFIPQGCMYLFSWGLNAAPRDENQHALAACYTNPELAKSAMRYILKKSDIKGNIPFNNVGHGVVTSKFYQTSDQQLFFFLLLSEYLRITGDYDFLHETVEYYPFYNAPGESVLHRIGEYFRYLKEDVGIGPHGLVRLGNSDWNDIVFYRIDTKYNANYYSNESFMNTTMAASVLPKLTRELAFASKKASFIDQRGYMTSLMTSLNDYRKKIWDSFLKEHGDRSFAKRMYFNKMPVGVDNMFLEPQGFLMQVEEYGIERKEALYSEIQKRILDSERTGARQEEKMELSELYFGSRENGGIWYSLNGPLILGLSTWNKEAAWELFHRMTLKNQKEQFPQYWSCYWSSFDAVNSSILPSEGLHAQHITWTPKNTKMTYCSHIHAWLLYSYKYLNDSNK